MYSAYNPNPMGARVGDCTVRAISRATGESWDAVYCGLCVEGLRLCDMPTANHVWGAYLRRHGFRAGAARQQAHQRRHNCDQSYNAFHFLPILSFYEIIRTINIF